MSRSHLFHLSATPAQFVCANGSRVDVTQDLFPVLKGMALSFLSLHPKGFREPHWHPNAHELNYLVKGKVRVTLLSPGEQVDTFEMQAGDMSFLPQGYFHSIENIGEESAQMTVFFNHATPSDIGLSGCLGAYSNELLADLFHVPTPYFESLPKFQEDLLIVAGGG
jgi:oxalate decarboxylase